MLSVVLLAALRPAHASEVHVEASEDCVVRVAGDEQRVKRRKSEKFKVDEGDVPVSVLAEEGGTPTWAGTLAVPRRVEVTLGCDGRSVRLLGAQPMTAAVAKMANTAMAVGAGAAAISDAASATGDAMDDMNAVGNGEMPASGSSRTEVTLDVGPGGVSSSTSRTTAGPGGVNHESSSTSIGSDGVSRSTASGQMNASGVSMEEKRRSVSIQMPGKGGVVTLTRTDAGAPAPAVGSAGSGAAGPAPAAVAPPAPEMPPPPKEVVFDPVSSQTVDGVEAEVRDPVANEGELKLNVKLTADEAAFVVFDWKGLEIEKPGSEPFGGDADKRTILDPGDSKGSTVVWPGDHRAPELRLHLGGVHRVPLAGAAVTVPDSALEEGELGVGPAQCDVRKVKQKGADVEAVLRCTTAVRPVVIDTSAISVGGVANAHKKAGPVLVWPDETAKIDLEVTGADGTVLQWGDAVVEPEAVQVGFETRPLTASW
jgi:hypothetical protein